MEAWRFRVMTLLRAKELIEVVEERIPEYEGRVWQNKNNEAVSSSVESLHTTCLEYAQGEKYARNIVSKLDKVYAQKSTANVLIVKKELSNLKPIQGGDLKIHLIKFCEIIGKFKRYSFKIR